MSDAPDLDININISMVLAKVVFKIDFTPMYQFHPYDPALAIQTGECDYTILADSVEFTGVLGETVRIKSAKIVITGFLQR
jgi:hypothetical protein